MPSSHTQPLDSFGFAHHQQFWVLPFFPSLGVRASTLTSLQSTHLRMTKTALMRHTEDDEFMFFHQIDDKTDSQRLIYLWYILTSFNMWQSQWLLDSYFFLSPPTPLSSTTYLISSVISVLLLMVQLVCFHFILVHSPISFSTIADSGEISFFYSFFLPCVIHFAVSGKISYFLYQNNSPLCKTTTFYVLIHLFLGVSVVCKHSFW